MFGGLGEEGRNGLRRNWLHAPRTVKAGVLQEQNTEEQRRAPTPSVPGDAHGNNRRVQVQGHAVYMGKASGRSRAHHR